MAEQRAELMPRKKQRNPQWRPAPGYVRKKPKTKVIEVVGEEEVLKFINKFHLDEQIWHPLQPVNPKAVQVRILFFEGDGADEGFTSEWYPVARVVLKVDVAGLTRLIRARPSSELPSSTPPLGRPPESNTAADTLTHCTAGLSKKDTVVERCCTAPSGQIQHGIASLCHEQKGIQPERTSLFERQPPVGVNVPHSGMQFPPGVNGFGSGNESQAENVSVAGNGFEARNRSQAESNYMAAHQCLTRVNESWLKIEPLPSFPHPDKQKMSGQNLTSVVSLQWSLIQDQCLVIKMHDSQQRSLFVHTMVTTDPLSRLSPGVLELDRLARAGHIRLCARIPSEEGVSDRLVLTMMAGREMMEEEADGVEVANKSWPVSNLVQELYPNMVGQVQPPDDQWLKVQAEEGDEGRFWFQASCRLTVLLR